MVHLLDRGLGLVLDHSLWPDPIYLKRRSGLGCYASSAKLVLKADLFRGYTEFYWCLVWFGLVWFGLGDIRQVVSVLHGIFCI